MYADSHCHINCQEFDADREDVVERAQAASVGHILDVCDDIADVKKIVAFCTKHKNIYTTVGVHPEVCDKYPNLSADDILAFAAEKYVVGIGECGLDYYYNKCNKNCQIKVFKEHIKAAQISGLPLIVHSRDADADMEQILQQEYKKKPFKGVMHCFCSSEQLANIALEIGFYISASGIITFKSADVLRDIFRKIPLSRLLAETDAPYLAPVPYRGKRNEPAYVVQTTKMLASLKEIDADKMADICRENFLQLFDKVNAND